MHKDVEIVKFSPRLKSTGATVDIYVSQEFHGEDEIYSGHGIIYPALASSPAVRRGFGLNVGIKYSINFEILSGCNVLGYGKTFASILKDYDFHGCAVEVIYINAPVNAATTYDATKHLRQVLEVTGMTLNAEDGTLTIAATDVWFKDKKIGKRVKNDGNAYFVNVEKGYNGEVGPIIFGEDVLFDLFYIDVEANKYFFFAGWEFQHPDTGYRLGNGGITQIYVKQRDAITGQNIFVPLDTDIGGAWGAARTGDDKLFGISRTGYASGTETGLYWFNIARMYSPTTYVLCACVDAWLGSAGTIDAEVGQLRFYIQEITEFSATELSDIGSKLIEVAIDPTTCADDFLRIPLPKPILLSPGKTYAFTLEWNNEKDTTNHATAMVKTATTGGPWAYKQKEGLEEEANHGWQVALTTTDFYLGAWALDQTDITPRVDSATGERFQELQLFADSTASTGGLEEFRNYKFVARGQGLADDDAGSYTGTPYTRLSNPAHIARLFLQHDEIGAGVADSGLDTAEIAATAGALDGVAFGFTLDTETGLQQLLADLCFQGRMVFYRTRQGKLSLALNTWGSAPGAVLAQGELGEGVLPLYIKDSDHGQIVNSIKFRYNADKLNVIDDPRRTRIADGDILADEIVITGDSAGDSQAVAAYKSASRWGGREFNHVMTRHNDATSARKIADFYLDKYHAKQERLTVRVDRRKFAETVDLFASVEVQDEAINSGSVLKVVTDYATDYPKPLSISNGGIVTSKAQSAGLFAGRVVEVMEQGPWLFLTLETEKTLYSNGGLV